MAPKSFLVTGASLGIGNASAVLLARKGHRVFAGVRSQKAMEELKKKSTNIYPVLLDVTSSDSIQQAKKQIAEINSDISLDGLVNNAAIAIAAPMEVVPLDEFRKIIDANVIGLVAVTQAFLPMIRKRTGRIVNVGSLSGLMTTPFLGCYCASKYAVEAITDALRMELHSSGIKVSLIEPGSIATPMWKNSLDISLEIEKKMSPELSLYRKALDSFRQVALKTGEAGISPERVALKIEHALCSPKPKTRYLVGKEALSYAVMKKILPDKAFDYLIYKELKMN